MELEVCLLSSKMPKIFKTQEENNSIKDKLETKADLFVEIG